MFASGILILRPSFSGRVAVASIESIAEGKPNDSMLRHYTSARVRAIRSSIALFYCANVCARARRLRADCRDADLVSRRTMRVIAATAPGLCAGRYSAASGNASGSSGIGVRSCGVVRRCTGIVSRWAMLVVRKSLCAVSNAYVGEGCRCGIFERRNACVHSRRLTFVRAGSGYYPPLYRFSASSSNAGGSQPPHGHEGAQGAWSHVGGRSFVLWVTLRTRTLAF